MALLKLRPDADGSNTGWIDQAGGSTNLFATVDEVTQDDADFVRSSNNPAGDIIRFRLSDPGAVLTQPLNVSYRYGTVGSGSMSITARLKQGSTVIASWVHLDASTTFKTVTQTLTSPEFAAITDFNDLFIEFEATANLFTAATWNPDDKDSSVALSSDCRSFNAENNSSVRATKSAAAGQKIYYENIADRVDFRLGFGFANAGFPLQGAPPGNEQYISNAISVARDGQIYMAAGNGATIFGGYNVGDAVDLAWIIEELFYVRVNNGPWNSAMAGTQDPATAQGGFVTNLIGKGLPWFPVGYGWLGGATANFGTGPRTGFTRAIPAGFTAP
jgi:hypothetical protein